ncbi:hypothetical protein V8E55_003507 [Tylopilus felleus]
MFTAAIVPLALVASALANAFITTNPTALPPPRRQTGLASLSWPPAWPLPSLPSHQRFSLISLSFMYSFHPGDIWFYRVLCFFLVGAQTCVLSDLCLGDMLGMFALYLPKFKYMTWSYSSTGRL